MIKKNNFNLLIIFISIFISSYFFSQIHLFEQRAIDAGLVLANIVKYPDEVSPMKEYFIKSWTSLHQISQIFLNFNWSFVNISKLIIFITATLYFIGIFLTISSTTKSIFLSILIAILTLVFQKNFGDTDYPSLVFSEHTYGMISLAMVTCIFGLLLAGQLFYAGFLSSLLICIHPLIGVWISGIIAISLILNKYYLKTHINNKKLIVGYVIGIFFTSISLSYYLFSTADFYSYFDLESYNNYMNFWEGHRNEMEIHFEYFSKTILLLFFIFLSLKIFKNNFTKNFKFGIIAILVSIILSSIFYFLYKFLLPNVPDIFIRLMPSRFTILHSVMGWPIILGILFTMLKKYEGNYSWSKNIGLIFITFIALGYSVSHYKVFINLKNLYINNTSQEILFTKNKKFWEDVKNTELEGYIITSFSSSTISMRKTLKPIILDVSSLDFVPYFPNTAKKMSIIIKEIYGIPFNNPPLNIKNRPFLTDDDIKNNFESYSIEKWRILSKKFKFHGIIVPVDWKIKITPKNIGDDFAFYVI